MTRLEELRAEAAGCRRCPLWQTGTQVVFGEGPARVESGLAPHVTATIHPSAVLRQRTAARRHEEMARFVEDLRLVAPVL